MITYLIVIVFSLNCRNNNHCNEKGITECDTLAYGNGEGRFCYLHVVMVTCRYGKTFNKSAAAVSRNAIS